MPVFECYGDKLPGTALVRAENRQRARQNCREWLGWSSVAAVILAADRERAWAEAGGTMATPVVYAADGEQFTVVRRKR